MNQMESAKVVYASSKETKKQQLPWISVTKNALQTGISDMLLTIDSICHDTKRKGDKDSHFSKCH